MDTALAIRIRLDEGQSFSDAEIREKLRHSILLQKLTADFPEKSIALIWRLICLSEIPFSISLAYTRELVRIIYSRLATIHGFSLSGDEKMFLPCYNAMIVSALCRLGLAGDKQVKVAVEWINENQPMKRGRCVNLPGYNFHRFGGCFKQTPCYIGLAKSVFALHDYSTSTGTTDYESQLKQGIFYLLEHRFFKRLSEDQPITKHITDISFPETYHLNAVELLRFAKRANLLNHQRSNELITMIENRRTKEGKWKNNFKYKAEGYVAFSDEWTTHIINHALSGRSK